MYFCYNHQMLCYKEGCRETIATRILIFYWLMGLSSMNLLIRLTEGTYTVFNRFDKPEGHPLLLSSGMTTDWAAFADLRHASVSICYRKCFHECFSNESCRLWEIFVRQRSRYVKEKHSQMHLWIDKPLICIFTCRSDNKKVK